MKITIVAYFSVQNTSLFAPRWAPLNFQTSQRSDIAFVLVSILQ